jgi:hypothetical protein
MVDLEKTSSERQYETLTIPEKMRKPPEVYKIPLEPS